MTKLGKEKAPAVVRLLPAARMGRELLDKALTRAAAALACCWPHPDLVVAGLAIGAPAECGCVDPVQTPKTSFHTGLEDKLWPAIHMHRCWSEMHSLCVYLLGPPLLYRVYYFRLMAALLVGRFRVAYRQVHRARLRTRVEPGADATCEAGSLS